MTANAPADTPIPRRRRRPLLLFVAVVVLGAAIAGGTWYWKVGRFYQYTDDAYVAAHVVAVTPQVGGTVVAVNVRDTDRVDHGDVLAELDPADTRIALDRAEAELARVLRQVRTVYAANDTLAADITVRRAEYQRARTEVEKAEDDYATRAQLVDSGAVGKEELKHAEAALATARANLTTATAAINAAEERLAANRALTDGIDIAHHPDVMRAAAMVREAYLAWSRTRIVAPIDGEVAKRTVQLGQRVQPGGNLLSLVPLEHVWVDANFKEVQLADMRVGQPVEVTADLYGGDVVYHGRVIGFAAGTGSAFALLPAQNASGNWIKIVQRVPVRVALDPDELAAHPLRVGLSMQVTVDVHDTSGSDLEAVPRGAEPQRTSVFEDAAHAADLRIESIIAANLGHGGGGVAVAD